jgi:molybdate transport system substrate-binding protein
VGALVLWLPKSTKLDLEQQGLAVLLDPAVLKVAIGNPAVSPYGAAAEQALRAAGLYERVKSKLVLGQSISQAAQFAQSGNAQAGLLPRSMALAPPLRDEGRFVLVPTDPARRLAQAGVVLKAAKAPAAAADFLRFVLSLEGRAILQQHGYSSRTNETWTWRRSESRCCWRR